MDANEPAFPTQMWDIENKEATWLDGGLTKREWLAGLAMQGLLSALNAHNILELHEKKNRFVLSTTAVDAADALIEALTNPAQPGAADE